jgi:GH24 family phage-related lysozyme (muramidase)
MLPRVFELRAHQAGGVTVHPVAFRHGRLVHVASTISGSIRTGSDGVGAWPSVVANWRAFNQPFEGVLNFMYTDALGLVTTGMGNLIDSPGAAQGLPWKNPDGSLADPDTVAAQWQAVKDGPINSSVNAGYLTTIRLDDAGIQQAIQNTMAQDIGVLRGYFPTWDSLPADAQLAILSMAWAMGPGFPATFTSFTASINAGDFDTAASQADFKGVGVANRIAANKFALHNAQIVSDQGLDPSTLYWPNVAGSGLSGSGTGTSPVLKVLALVAGGFALGGAAYFGAPYIVEAASWTGRRLAA